MIYPSVTEILSPYSDFSKIRPDVLEAAAARGTAVHDICATIARGLPVLGIPPECGGFIASFQLWRDFIVQDVLLVEDRLIDESFGYHGQIDLIVKAKHGETILVDLKTPISLQKSWRIQLALYRHLCEINGYKIDRVGSLRLDRDGGIAKFDEYSNQAQDLNIGIQCLTVYRFFNTKK